MISATYTWAQFIPEFTLVGLATLILMADCFLPKLPKSFYALFGAAGAVAAAFFMNGEAELSQFRMLAVIATALTILLAYDYRKITCEAVSGTDSEEGSSELYALPLIACAGICALTQAKDIIMLFVSLEVVTLSSYVLAGYFRRNQGSIEAGVKYLILGAMSTGLLVFGAAWYYGMTGTFLLDAAVVYHVFFAADPAMSVGFMLAMALLLAGAFFKTGTAPMHIWIPDVYQGAPTPISAFLAVASKTAGFAVLCMLLAPFADMQLVPMLQCLVILTAITLLIGNLGAIGQTNAKRLLGYSSIAQAGFIMVFLINGTGAEAQAQVASYLTAYLLATMAAFYAIAMVRTQRGSEEISAFRALGKTNPVIAFLITVAFASLAGVPLTYGFIVKFNSFCALVSAYALEDMSCWFTTLLIIMIIGAAAGFYYYFKVIREMYWEKPQAEDKPLCIPMVTAGVMTACVILLIALGTWPLLTGNL
ncbi:MAG: NADH-quinone oxidoreductase subunit N [Akkermansia sp.]|nr:NADH-quinone oxidoreductase subunit N [Akkermansia sp.]